MKDITNERDISIVSTVPNQGVLVHQVPIENNYRILVEKIYEPKWILVVSNRYYETLSELEGLFIAWPPHLVHLNPDPIRFLFNLLKY